MSRREDEEHLRDIVSGALRRWLAKARDVVMAPFREYRLPPDSTAIYSTQEAWNDELDTILTTIGEISLHAWSEATDVPSVSRHAFVVAALAQTENLLVRIPDETYNLVFAELSEGVNAGESLEQLAARVDQVLSYTGSERWTNRAKVIAQTETTRAYGAATVAAGMEMSRVSGRLLRKVWETRDDSRVRSPHREVDGEVRDLSMPFYVDGIPMLFPGDPSAPADLVCGCRCSLRITNEGGR